MQVADQVADWKRTAAEILDVRPTLADGGEPFVAIMEAAERVPAGQSLIIIAPFEPAPLYGALGARGFGHETQSLSASEWVVRFTREG
ncbi:MAG TPA: DUF2249 domain-containing protein [Ktedonobacterales bacterium]